MRAVIIGAVESTAIALRTIGRSAGWEIAALITLPPALAGRHADFVDLGEAAAARGVRVIPAADSNAPEILEILAALRPDYTFVIGWSQICRPAFLDVAGPVIGYHPAALPRLRGRAAIPWTILLDEKITASTLFWIDRDTDSGPILAQRFFHVAPDEHARTLYAKHMAALEGVLAQSLPLLASGTAPRTPQDPHCATWCAKRTREDGRIDWAQPAQVIARLVRAVGPPYPGAFTTLAGRRLTLLRARVVAAMTGRIAAMTGQVTWRDPAGFVVRCGDGQDLGVDEFAWSEGTREPPALHASLGRIDR